MTNQEILAKAISKAIDGGWKHERISMPQLSAEYWSRQDYRALVYRHEFARALWGDRFINPEMRDDTGSKVIAMKRTAWKFHLQMMVISDDPIKYLGEHI